MKHKITLAQEQYFIRRTIEHIRLVQNNMIAVANAGGMFGIPPMEIVRRAISHDISKFDEDKYRGYVLYEHRNRKLLKKAPSMREKEYLDTLDDFIFSAVKKHRKQSPHHPEHFRDVNGMSALDIIELACDWKAVEQRFCDRKRTARAYADYACKELYAFNRRRKDMIFTVLDFLDGKSQKKAE